MKKFVVTACVLVPAMFLSEASFAADAKAAKPKVKRSELIKRSMMRRFGGLIQHPDSYRGKILISCFGDGWKDEVEAVIVEFKKNLNIRIENVQGEKPTLENVGRLREKSGAEAVLFLTDDARLPRLLTAPEDRWVIVNLNAISEGSASDAAAKRRVRCEIARGLAHLAGAASSTFPNSLMTSVTSLKGLDYVTDEMPPMEVFSRMPNYLKGLGITPLLRVPYSRACEEGWAPAPTNEFQKAIWDKVHAVPKKPMKIEFDPKKGR